MDVCSQMSTVTPCRGNLTTVRQWNGKELMAYRQFPSLTTYMVDYIPPSIMPSYNRGLPGVAVCFSTVGGAANKKHLQSERNDLLGNRIRRKFLYGRLPCEYSPFPDVSAAGRVMKWNKLNVGGTITPSNVDKTRRQELRDFHERCVNYRDYYLDKTDTLIGPDSFFDVGRPYPVRCPIDERTFKIPRSEDICDRPGWLGPPLRCSAMPCLKMTKFLSPEWYRRCL